MHGRCPARSKILRVQGSDRAHRSTWQMIFACFVNMSRHEF